MRLERKVSECRPTPEKPKKRRKTKWGHHESSKAAWHTLTLLDRLSPSIERTPEIFKENTAVKVTGEAPLIHAENGDVSTTLDQTQISEVPNPGNDLTYIAQTAPGVLMNTDVQGGANFSILGMKFFLRGPYSVQARSGDAYPSVVHF
jgi:hypothetical protein